MFGSSVVGIELGMDFSFDIHYSLRPDDGCSSDGDLCDIEHPVMNTSRPKLLSVTSLSTTDGGRLLDGPLKEGWLYKLTKTPAG